MYILQILPIVHIFTIDSLISYQMIQYDKLFVYKKNVIDTFKKKIQYLHVILLIYYTGIYMRGRFFKGHSCSTLNNGAHFVVRSL